MATVINNPDTSDSANSMNSTNMSLMIVVFILLFLAAFYLWLPYMRGAVRTPQPTQNNSQQQPTIQVPEQIDVNINRDQEGQN